MAKNSFVWVQSFPAPTHIPQRPPPACSLPASSAAHPAPHAVSTGTSPAGGPRPRSGTAAFGPAPAGIWVTGEGRAGCSEHPPPTETPAPGTRRSRRGAARSTWAQASRQRHLQSATGRSPSHCIYPSETLKNFSVKLFGMKFGSGALWEGSDRFPQ